MSPGKDVMQSWQFIRLPCRRDWHQDNGRSVRSKDHTLTNTTYYAYLLSSVQTWISHQDSEDGPRKLEERLTQYLWLLPAPLCPPPSAPPSQKLSLVSLSPAFDYSYMSQPFGLLALRVLLAPSPFSLFFLVHYSPCPHLSLLTACFGPVWILTDASDHAFPHIYNITPLFSRAME